VGPTYLYPREPPVSQRLLLFFFSPHRLIAFPPQRLASAVPYLSTPTLPLASPPVGPPMVSGDEAYHGSSGRIRGAGGRDRRGGGKIVGGVSSRIRSGTRSRRRILGPCDGPPHADVSTLAASFMSPTRRIKALGWILLRCDLNWNCKSTTAMSQTQRSEPPPWSCRRRLRQIGPLRRSLLRVVHWGK
jgi:hypothetical protein